MSKKIGGEVPSAVQTKNDKSQVCCPVPKGSYEL